MVSLIFWETNCEGNLLDLLSKDIILVEKKDYRYVGKCLNFTYLTKSKINKANKFILLDTLSKTVSASCKRFVVSSSRNFWSYIFVVN